MESFLVVLVSFIIINYVFIQFMIGYSQSSAAEIQTPIINDTYELGFININNRIQKLEKSKPCNSFVAERTELKQLSTEIKKLNQIIDRQNKILNTQKQEKSRQTTPVKKTPTAQTKETTIIEKIDQNIYEDCVQALIKLGCKKSTAKKEVSNYLIKNNISSVEEFINNFFKDRHDKSHCSD